MRTVYGPSNSNLNSVLCEAARSILSLEKLVFYSKRITAVCLDLDFSLRVEAPVLDIRVLQSTWLIREKKNIFHHMRSHRNLTSRWCRKTKHIFPAFVYIYFFPLLLFTTPLPCRRNIPLHTAGQWHTSAILIINICMQMNVKTKK